MRGSVLILCLAISVPLFANEVRHDAITISHQPRSLADIARDAKKNRTGKCKVLTNEDVSDTRPLSVVSSSAGSPAVVITNRPSPLKPKPKSASDLPEWISGAERAYARLASQCQSAGADRSYPKPYQTDTYVVNGKTVRVSGYHANPDEIRHAKNICQDAMNVGKQLSEAKKQLSGSKSR